MKPRMQNHWMVSITLLLVGIAIGRFLFGGGDHDGHPEPNRQTETGFKEHRILDGRLTLSQHVAAGADRNSTSNLSPEEQRQEEELKRRRARGEYILQYESPAIRDRLEKLIERGVTETAERNSAEYARTFASFGLSPDASEKLILHISQIQRASLEVETALQQLYSAKTEFQGRLKSVLSEEDLSKYQQFEERKRVDQEFARLAETGVKSGIAVNPAYKESIAAIIQETQAYTEKSWHGPLDGLPEPAIGRDMVLRQLEQDIASLSEQANAVSLKASQAELPPEYQNLLASHFRQAIERKQKTIDSVINPVPDHE